MRASGLNSMSGYSITVVCTLRVRAVRVQISVSRLYINKNLSREVFVYYGLCLNFSKKNLSNISLAVSVPYNEINSVCVKKLLGFFYGR